VKHKKALADHIASLNLAATVDLEYSKGVRSAIEGLDIKEG
jgi:hypothetical protein